MENKLLFKIAWFLVNGRRKVLKILEKTAFLLESGIPIKEAINSQYILAKMDKDIISLEVLKSIYLALQEGKTLSAGIKPFVSKDEYTLLLSAERTGALPLAIQNILRLDKEKRESKKILMESISSPLLVLVIAIGLIYYIGTQVLPPIVKFIGKDKITGSTKVIIYITDFVSSPLFFITIAGFVFLIIVIFATFPYLTGKIRVYLDKLLPWSLYKEYTGIMFLISLSVMVSSGIPIVQALKQMLSESTPYLRERIKVITALMLEGKSFGEALYYSGFEFPDREITYDMLIFSKYPNVEKKMFKIIEERFDAFKLKLHNSAKKISGLIHTGVYIIVIMIVLFVAQLMMNLTSNIGGK